MTMWEKILKVSILMPILIALLLFAGIVAYTNISSFSAIESNMLSNVMDDRITKTSYASSKIESHVMEVKDDLVKLSKFPITGNIDLNECSNSIKANSKIESVLRADKSGNIVECSSSKFSDYLGLNIENKDYFIMPKERKEPFIQTIEQGNSRQVIIAAPLFETKEYTPYPNFIGDFKGVLLSIIDARDLYNVYIFPVLESTGDSFLLVNLENNETILKSTTANYSSIARTLSNPSVGSQAIVELDGPGETILTFSNLHLGEETWRLIILTPLESQFNEFRSVKYRNMFTLAFVSVLILGAFFLLMFQKSRKAIPSDGKIAVSLEKLGISIGTEENIYSQTDIVLSSKNMYLVKEDDENHAHELFISCLNNGFSGLGIVRENPDIIKKKYNLQNTPFIWLTKNKVENIPCETDINNLHSLIMEFVKKTRKSAILLDRLDYILSENSPESIIHNIHALKDITLANECIIILSVNSSLMDPSVLMAIENDSIDLYGKSLKSKVELSSLEIDVLKFVNDNNTKNKLVAYKDITERIGVTKPTTRAKINRLLNLGLLTVDKRGRFKSIKITSAGRKIIS